MIRLVMIALALVAGAWLFVRLCGELGKAEVDWTGVAFAAGFVALAFYLSEATDIGGLG